MVSPHRLIKPPLGAAPVANLILSKIRGSNSAFEQYLDIVIGVKGSHAPITHEQPSDVMEQDRIEENRKGLRPRVNAEPVLGVRFVQRNEREG